MGPNKRQFSVEFAIERHQVRMAEAGGFDTDEDLVGGPGLEWECRG